jgi:hypothetical protein
MSQEELAAIGRQFIIFCAEREALLRRCQELQTQLNKALEPTE